VFVASLLLIPIVASFVKPIIVAPFALNSKRSIRLRWRQVRKLLVQFSPPTPKAVLLLTTLVSPFIVPYCIFSDRIHEDPTNWTWEDPERHCWEKVATRNPWQKFADKWRHSKELELGDLSGSFLNDISLPPSQDSSLMVRKCYLEAEKLIWKQARSMPGTGVIITGQPGIGMIILQIYVCPC
jgi:hypothetical protein